MELQPGVVTFRPDNLFTVGLMVVITYGFAVLLVQVLMRAGLLGPPGASMAKADKPAPGTVAV